LLGVIEEIVPEELGNAQQVRPDTALGAARCPVPAKMTGCSTETGVT
jgi:hypothetical protein